MNDIVKSENLHLMAQEEFRKAIKEMEDAIRKKHKKVSGKETNPNHVKQKAGMDYVEFAYMKSMANEYYPGWSFKNLEIVEEFLVSGWVVVKGELHFIDEGIPRVGACAAAHRIAFKSGMDRVPENIVDLGNDVKAAVTDCQKKGFNTYMNISDDIYRQIEIEDISDDQRKILYDMIEDCSSDKQKQFYSFVDNRTTKSNFADIARKILGALYSHQKSIDESKATTILNKFKDRLESEFDVSIEK